MIAAPVYFVIVTVILSFLFGVAGLLGMVLLLLITFVISLTPLFALNVRAELGALAD